MNADGSRSNIPRDDRRPLFVHVVTDPLLAGCWSLNIARSGIGLVTSQGDADRPPIAVGDALTVALRLPEQAHFEARGTVAWVRTIVPARHEPSGGVALGVRFDDVGPSERLALERFLAERRYPVVVVGASAGQRDRLVEACAGFADLAFVDEGATPDAVGARTAPAVIVVCATDDDAMRARLTRFTEPVTRGALPTGTGGDVGPRLMLYGASRSDDVVRWFNAGLLAHALPLDAHRNALRDGVLATCREHEVHVEQRFAAVEAARRRWADRGDPRLSHAPAPAPRHIVATSDAMRSTLDLARHVATHPLSVLLEGETGTGKELLARFIHDESARATGPFVVQDCGTLTETLLESELFGHMKGAFTGATHDHPGLFALADGGTIFLDEVENTTAALQAKLLRVLETGEVRPVGGAKVRRVDVRVVCATNRDLGLAAREGRFRTDLYYRLSAFPIALPPLRERVDDVVPLARHFIARAEQRLGIAAGALDDAAARALRGHRWPGNVRELKNVMERALILAGPRASITAAHLPGELTADVDGDNADASTLDARVARYEREMIKRALSAVDGVVARAAARLGVNRVTLTRKIARHGLATRDSGEGAVVGSVEEQ